MTYFVAPVSKNFEIFFLLITACESTVLLLSKWIWIISWEFSSQQSELSLGLCMLMSEYCETLPSSNY